MRVLLVTPMKKEYHCAREVLGASEFPFDDPFRLARLQSNKLTLHILQCAFHPVRALELYRDEFGTPDLLIDSGSCGALREGIGIGEQFRVDRVIRRGEEPLFYDSPGTESSLPVTSLIEVSRGVSDSERKKELGREAGLCSMESYTLCSIAGDWGCTRYSFRVVSDFADESLKSDFKKNIRQSCLGLYRFLATFLNDLSH